MQIFYYHEFIQELENLDPKVRKQIRAKLKELYRLPLDQFEPFSLKGKQFKGLFKLRVGDWRLIYKIIEEEICFITLGHRSKIYEN